MDTTERFFEKIYMDEKGCWIWQASKHKNGYGQFHKNNKKITAHRAAWILFCGSIPRGMCVCHKCDVRCCVNPSHLFLGTQKDNVRDMIKKGRSTFGEKNFFSKLDEIKILKIRYLYEYDHEDIASLSKKFNLSQSYIRKILRGDAWKHLKLNSIKLPYLQNGEKNNNAKLNEKIIKKIRLLKRLKTMEDLSKEYGVSKGYISDIWRYKVWKNV